MPLGVEQWLRGYTPRKARNALYAGKQIIFGNKVSNDYGKKSRRIWKPNVVEKQLYSDALGEEVKIKLTAAALRQIDRAGGLDRYLLKTPDRLLHSDFGSDLKFRIGLIYRQRWHKEAMQRSRLAAKQQQQLLGQQQPQGQQELQQQEQQQQLQEPRQQALQSSPP